jgi:hypothetical protein
MNETGEKAVEYTLVTHAAEAMKPSRDALRFV